MNPKAVETLEDCLKKLPLLPARYTMHLMAKAAVAVYKAGVENQRREEDMAFDESLAGRLLDSLARKKGVEEKKMFGGSGSLLHGNMLVGVWKDSLIARLGPDEYGDALIEPHVREFDITGRPMKGWAMVEPEGVEDDDQLAGWIRRASKFVGKLAAK